MLTLTPTNFKSEVEDFSGIAVVDFSASWCMPCKMLHPILEKYSLDKQSETIKFCEIDGSDYPEYSQKYGVMGFPTIIIFKGGQVVGQTSGFAGIETIRKIDELVENNK